MHAPNPSAPPQRYIGHVGAVTALKYLPDDSALASAGEDSMVHIWAPSVRSVCDSFKAHHGGVRSLDVTADGRYLLTGGDDKCVKIWHLPSRRFLRTYSGHTNWVRSVAVNPAASGAEFASCGDDLTVAIWDGETGERKHVFRDHVGAVTGVHFSPDGSAVASGSADCSVNLWDCRSREILQHYAAHADSVTGIDFHPSGLFLSSVSLDGSVRTWDLRQGRQLYALLPGRDSYLQRMPPLAPAIHALAYSRDGSLLATAGEDERVLVFTEAVPLPRTWHDEDTPITDRAPGNAHMVATSSKWTPAGYDSALKSEAAVAPAEVSKLTGASAGGRSLSTIELDPQPVLLRTPDETMAVPVIAARPSSATPHARVRQPPTAALPQVTAPATRPAAVPEIPVQATRRVPSAVGALQQVPLVLRTADGDGRSASRGRAIVPTEASLARERDTRAAADASASAKATAAKRLQAGPGAAAYIPPSARERSRLRMQASAVAGSAPSGSFSRPPRLTSSSSSRDRNQWMDQPRGRGMWADVGAPTGPWGGLPGWGALAPGRSAAIDYSGGLSGGGGGREGPSFSSRGPEGEIDAARRSFYREDPSVGDALRYVVTQLNDLKSTVGRLSGQAGASR